MEGRKDASAGAQPEEGTLGGQQGGIQERSTDRGQNAEAVGVGWGCFVLR